MSGRLLNRHTATPEEIRNAKYIGRGTPYGNPYSGPLYGDRATCVRLFEINVLPTLDLTPLLGHDLLCSCEPMPCHGDPILWALYRGL